MNGFKIKYKIILATYIFINIYGLLAAEEPVQYFAGGAADSTATNDGASSQTLFGTIWSDIKASGKDFFFAGQRIINPEFNDIYYLSGALVLTASSFTFDESLDAYRRKAENKTITDALDFSNNFGEVYYALLFSGGLYGGGLLFGSEDARITARLMFETLALAGLTTTLVKVCSGRARPYLNKGAMEFAWFEFSDNFNSFPSGHATVAFSLAAVAAYRIDTWWSYPLFFSGAALTGAARINKGKHWLSDTILGGAIGTACGILLVNAEERSNNGNANISQKVLLYPVQGGLGISWQF